MNEISGILGVAVAIVAVYPCIFLHEVGHLVAAYVNGWTPYVLRCGTGPRITLLKFGELHVQFGLRPRGGLLQATANSPTLFRLKWLFSALAGPTVTGAIAWGLWQLLQFEQLSSATPFWITAATGCLMLLEAISLLVNLLPHTIILDGEKIPSDGLQALQSLTWNKQKIAEQFIAHRAGKAVIYLERGEKERAKEALEQLGKDKSMDSLQTRLVWVYLLLNKGRSEAADAEMASMAENWQPLGKSRGEVLDALACVPLFGGHRDLREKALWYIEEAILEEPETITFKGTKGSLLVESGRSEEGLKLLTEVIEHTQSTNDVAICSYYIALAHSELGAWSKGRELLQEAQAKYPECSVRSRVTTLFWDKREITKTFA